MPLRSTAGKRSRPLRVMRFAVTFAVVAAVGGSLVSSVGLAAEGQEMPPEVERAITRAQRYLLKIQAANGSFPSRETVGGTALGLMAFMVQGEFPDRGPQGEALARAVDYLLQRGRANNGYIAVIDHGMYEHALATLALSEAWGMSQRTEIRDALKEAVAVLVRAQSRSGGWRYKPQPGDQDLSVAAIVVISLLSARESGIHVPAETLEKGLEYIRSCQEKSSGGYGYQRPSNPGVGRTGAGTLTRQLAGEKDPGVVAGLEFLRRQPNNVFEQTDSYFYAHYYCTLAMYQSNDADYLHWYPKARDAILKRQRGNGSFGQVWETGYAALILGIPYRYIPIYQRTEFEEAS